MHCFPREDYLAGVTALRGAIHQGECFQAVLSQRFEAEARGDPFALYRVLRLANPSPHMFFYESDGITLIGYWSPTDEKEAEKKLYYVLAYPSKAAADKSCRRLNKWSTRRGVVPRKSQRLPAISRSPMQSPTSGEMKMNRMVRVHPDTITAVNPAFATAAPA